jgi:hypothetical protein
MNRINLLWLLASAISIVSLVAIASGMKRSGSFDHQPNFLHLKGSPYGRTIAYAMRGPADLYWHRGQVEDHDHGGAQSEHLGLEAHEDDEPLESVIQKMKLQADHHHDHDHGADHHDYGSDVDHHDHDSDADHHDHDSDADHHDHDSDADHHDHGSDVDHHDHGSDADHHEDPAKREEPQFGSLREELLYSIKGMRTTYYTRTNPNGDTPEMKAWRLGKAEKLLKLSYEMDPTNIICYGSYYLFLSESLSRLVGSDSEQARIQEGEERALKLSIATLAACGKFPDEPTAAITAASAASDAEILLRKSAHSKPGAADAMHGHFRQALQHYTIIRDQMISDGTWENYSVYRREEMESVFALMRCIYLAREKE